MLDFQALRQQLSAFTSHQLEFQEDVKARLTWAIDLYNSRVGSEEPWLVAPEGEKRAKLMAVPLTDTPASYSSAPDRPTPITVVATDGSQIYPDRHREPLWYLINVSKIVFHYGTLNAPVLESVPSLYYRGQALDGLQAEDYDVTGRDIISAFRDEQELRTLHEIAVAHKQEEMPLLAMADGTLIRWMLKGIKNESLEAILLSRYVEILDGFRKDQIPLCSYISMPANKEFVRLLARQSIEDAEARESKIKDLNDRLLFEQVLPRGTRTPLFKSQSKILSEYHEDLHVCFFYVHVEASESVHEIARVEVPFWMANDAEWINLVHATVLSEAKKGRGYPMILSEAHEHAVVRGSERAMFYEMIEKLSVEQGRPLSNSMKMRSKERALL